MRNADQRGLVPAHCAKCGKEFYPGPEHVYRTSRRKVYCSWTCFNHRKDNTKPLPRYRAVEQLTRNGVHITTFQSANNAMECMGYTTKEGSEFRRAIAEGGEYRGYIWRYKNT